MGKVTEDQWSIVNKLGEYLGIDDVLLALGIDAPGEYRGSLSEAIQILIGHAGEVEQQNDLFKAAAQLPEAIATANASFQTPAGAVWQVTIRPTASSDLVVAAMKSLVESVRVFESAVIRGRGWTPVQRYSQIPATGPGSPKSLGPTVQQPSEAAGLYTRRGVGELLFLTVKGGRVQYKIDGLQYEIGDARPAETVVGYWSDGCWNGRFDPQCLEKSGVYDSGDFGQTLMVRFGKNHDTGYWDALAVFPESEQ